ncbi:MAG: hypothetical protein N2Z74_08180, partial [Syntrophales bacterium]|nr:hypothetical protein [Syntrophales bacterium]
TYKTIIGNSYGELIAALHIHGIRYLVWEEKHWPKDHYDLLSHGQTGELINLGEWYHPDSGRIVLFAVRH